MAWQLNQSAKIVVRTKKGKEALSLKDKKIKKKRTKRELNKTKYILAESGG